MTTSFDEHIDTYSTAKLYDSANKISFTLPPVLEATEPPEIRGGRRDSVRLLVTNRFGNNTHSLFNKLDDFLNFGDLLIVNTSATRNAAIDAVRHDEEPFVIHFSNRLDNGQWVVEIRIPKNEHTERYQGSLDGDQFHLVGGAVVILIKPNPNKNRSSDQAPPRLWIAEFVIPLGYTDADEYLSRYGRAIRYKYVPKQWPIEYYQTIFATTIGSAEMPSAGRPFTSEVVASLKAKGVAIAPILLHTGVASLESHEAPYNEYFEVSRTTANLVNETHKQGGRVIAVGTTAVRALESVTDRNGYTQEGNGWTDLMITPQRGLHAIDGLLTGFHEPEATHLQMLLAIKSMPMLQAAYDEALANQYLWHEFGDMHLIMR